jgi:hypothetical protein
MQSIGFIRSTVGGMKVMEVITDVNVFVGDK